MSFTMPDPEQAEPLLSPDSTSDVSDYGTAKPAVEVSRSIEYDVLPETATYGRNLSWASAYILVISRVIGSGIFAMPGTIVKSVGSIGIALLLWIFGAFIAWCGCH